MNETNEGGESPLSLALADLRAARIAVQELIDSFEVSAGKVAAMNLDLKTAERRNEQLKARVDRLEKQIRLHNGEYLFKIRQIVIVHNTPGEIIGFAVAKDGSILYVVEFSVIKGDQTAQRIGVYAAGDIVK